MWTALPRRLRGALLALAIVPLGCVTPVEDVRVPVVGPLYEDPLAFGCPYASVHVAVSSETETKSDEIAERVRAAYTESLIEQGFVIVSEPADAYWSAFSLVHLSQRIDSTFAWSLYMMATADAEGGLQSPLDFASPGDEAVERSGFMLLREIRIRELDEQVRRAGMDTAVALRPHANRMCVAWALDPNAEILSMGNRGRWREEESIRALRRELEQEILRARRDRQRRSIEVHVEEGPDL